jgi:hypothetical protein
MRIAATIATYDVDSRPGAVEVRPGIRSLRLATEEGRDLIEIAVDGAPVANVDRCDLERFLNALRNLTPFARGRTGDDA